MLGMRKLVALGLFATVLLCGCSGSIRQDVSSVRLPSLVRFLPHGYRVVKTYRADLTGGIVPDLVVTSEGVAGTDLQVLSWSTSTRRWRLTFDGLTAKQPNVLVPGPQAPNAGPGQPWRFHTGTAPLIGNVANGVVVAEISVAFAPLLGGRRDQLVFGGPYAGGNGFPGFLAVASFQSGVGKIIYASQGAPEGGWRISHDIIHFQMGYLLAGAAQVGPWIAYRFGLAARAGHIVEVSDTRPFLGVVLSYPRSRPPVVRLVARHGPAAGRLRRGDLILSVENAPKTWYAWYHGQPGAKMVRPGSKNTLKYDILDTMSSFHAGQTIRLRIRRGSNQFTVRVKLGSVISTAASTIRAPKHDGIL
jgi:hypothetical protein